MLAARPQLDSRIEVVTPENIAFQYRVAGPFRRLPAYLIDLLICGAAILGVGLLLVFIFGLVTLEGLGLGLAMVFSFLMLWFYGGFFETYWNGQTPGKRMFRIRVLSIDGSPINALQAVMRNILRVVDALPVVPMPGSDLPVPILPLYMVGLITPMFNDRYQRLGDLACGTMVVVEDRAFGFHLPKVTEPEAMKLAELLPAGFQPTRSLSRALSSYVARRRFFSPGRRVEIAKHLAPALIAKFNLPNTTNYDLLLCALYYRTFITDRGESEEPSPTNIQVAPHRGKLRVGVL